MYAECFTFQQVDQGDFYTFPKHFCLAAQLYNGWTKIAINSKLLEFWLSLPMANSAYAIVLHCHHWCQHHWHQHQHHCNLCLVPLVTWLMSVMSYVYVCMYIYRHTFPINVHTVRCVCGIYVAFQGYICCSHKYSNSMLNKCWILLFFTYIYAVIKGLYVDYSSSEVRPTYATWQVYLFRGIYH